MNENRSKRREWVKTAAIIFLSILLVLTFFSQTILNHSLPEVATKYVQSGSITSKIRGSGTIESGDPYTVEIASEYIGRKVASINFRKGDKVQKGDILFYLAEGDSTELENARAELKTAQDAVKTAQDKYDEAILKDTVTNSDIAVANSNMSVTAYRQKLTDLQNKLKDAKSRLEPVKASVKQLEQAIADCDTQITYEGEQDRLADSRLGTAKNALDYATANKETAHENVEAAEAAVAEIREESARFEAELVAGNATPAPTAAPTIVPTAAPTIAPTIAPTAAPTTAPTTEPAPAQTDAPVSEGDDQNVEDAQPSDNTQNMEEDQLPSEEENLQEALTASRYTDEEIRAKRNDLANRLAAAEAKLAEARAVLEQANINYNNALADYNNAASNKETRGASQTTNNVSKNRADYAYAKDGYVKQQNAIQTEIEDLENQIKDLIGDSTIIAELQTIKNEIKDAQDNVEKKRKKVKELEESTSANAITADISGTITEINVSSGKKIETQDVVILQPEGQEYTMSFSVTNDQAKTVSVGDKASLVNYIFYDDMDITLKSIKTDKNDPGKSKLLTFTVEGDCTVGQTLNVSVGQKNQNYDFIVPNSAIRNDTNGHFILIIESKSSPLGNRYIATRVDVQILAEDDTQTAVSGAINGWEYVITTATREIKAGEQVRITDN